MPNRDKKESPAERAARIARRAVVDTYEILTSMDANDAAGCLGGHIANIIGPIPDDFWRRMKMSAEMPCGRAGCNCEAVKIEVFSALETLRDDWRASVDEPDKIPKPK